jgi:hypothetical protein
MKRLILFFLAGTIVILSTIGCNPGKCHLTKEDSIRIARITIDKYADTFPRPIRITGRKDLISLDEAVAEHMAYLQHQYDAKETNIYHSLYISKEDINMLQAKSSSKGVKINFGMTTDQFVNYLTLVLVPLDNAGRNIVWDHTTNKSTIVNKLQPCPDDCPEGNVEGQARTWYANTINHINDFNYDKNKELWFKPMLPGTDKWVDINNQPPVKNNGNNK